MAFAAGDKNQSEEIGSKFGGRESSFGSLETANLDEGGRSREGVGRSSDGRRDGGGGGLNCRDSSVDERRRRRGSGLAAHTKVSSGTRS